MILKFKSFIYKATGLFLAENELNAYLADFSTISEIASEAKDKKELYIYYYLYIGRWKQQHGFAEKELGAQIEKVVERLFK
jgi:hypothetical protein